jgi:hypothetical protein
LARGYEGRVARAATEALRVGPDPAEMAAHRSGLRAQAIVADFLRRWAAPEDAGPGLSLGLALGEAAAAELALIPDTPELRAADAAFQPCHGADPRQELWRRLARLAARDSPGRAPDTPAAALARAMARANGGAFPPFDPDIAYPR